MDSDEPGGGSHITVSSVCHPGRITRAYFERLAELGASAEELDRLRPLILEEDE